MDTYDGLHPVFAERVRQLNDACGTWIVSGYRSSAKQAELYECWRRGVPGCNPANQPGTSNHEAIPWGQPMGLAVDLGGDLQAAHSRAPQLGLHFPISAEPWHAQPTEVTSPAFTAVPDLRGPTFGMGSFLANEALIAHLDRHLDDVTRDLQHHLDATRDDLRQALGN